jgi:hypothetical protein
MLCPTFQDVVFLTTVPRTFTSWINRVKKESKAPRFSALFFHFSDHPCFFACKAYYLNSLTIISSSSSQAKPQLSYKLFCSNYFARNRFQLPVCSWHGLSISPSSFYFYFCPVNPLDASLRGHLWPHRQRTATRQPVAEAENILSGVKLYILKIIINNNN